MLTPHFSPSSTASPACSRRSSRLPRSSRLCQTIASPDLALTRTPGAKTWVMGSVRDESRGACPSDAVSQDASAWKTYERERAARVRATSSSPPGAGRGEPPGAPGRRTREDAGESCVAREEALEGGAPALGALLKDDEDRHLAPPGAVWRARDDVVVDVIFFARVIPASTMVRVGRDRADALDSDGPYLTIWSST